MSLSLLNQFRGQIGVHATDRGNLQGQADSMFEGLKKKVSTEAYNSDEAPEVAST